jgi:hypothetical protein
MRRNTSEADAAEAAAIGGNAAAAGWAGAADAGSQAQAARSKVAAPASRGRRRVCGKFITRSRPNGFFKLRSDSATRKHSNSMGLAPVPDAAIERYRCC